MKEWPGSNGITSDKVPTEFTYDIRRSQSGISSNNSSQLIDQLDVSFALAGSLKPIRFGLELMTNERRIQCIKLLLDRYQSFPSYASCSEILEDLLQNQRNVVDAVADFLAAMYGHTMNELRKRYDEPFVRSTPIEWVLTVPAIWSEQAKDRTLQAAKKAGMCGQLRLVSEPEAAALYSLRSIHPNHLKVGDIIVVVDAGGGTVDIIAYRIIALNPLEVEEVQFGTGKLCGSVFLNLRFEEHVRSKVGVEMFDKLCAQKPRTWHEAMKCFEQHVKRQFKDDCDEHDDFFIPFPGVEDFESANIVDGFMTLTHGEVKAIFDPIVDSVLELVKQQVSKIHKGGKLISAIVLVGGFGQSNCLHTKLRRQFMTNDSDGYFQSQAAAVARQPSHKRISILRPLNSWTAVERGAVMRGLEGTLVKERRARYHYGTDFDAPYRKRKHPQSSQFWCDCACEFRAKGAMKWYVSKNDKVSEQRAITFPFTRYVYDKDDDNEPTRFVREAIWASDSEEAPLMHSATMRRVCWVDVDLSVIPRRAWGHIKRDFRGRKYHELQFDLEMRIDSASMELEVKIGGVGYGLASASFDDC